MVQTSPGYGITIRVEGRPEFQPVAEITAIISREGATITALDVAESQLDNVVIDVTCDAIDSTHADRITVALSASPILKVRKVSDRTFLLHLGGKLEVQSKVPLKTRDDLSRAYTPGVARICQAIAKDPSDARRLTIKRNTVAVVTDGSAVLGLGNLGPAAALPVMEGKAALFKRFADVDAWPVCLDTQSVDEIVRTVQLLAPVYGGINLEDISAPRCFEIEARLRELLDIPVFHDDQHGTAIVTLAALLNSLKLVKKQISEVKIVISGAGAAGNAIVRLLIISGAKNICNELGVADEKFYTAISTFEGAANRLQFIGKNEKTVIYKDFAHSPSKLKATVHAMKEQFAARQLVAVMELHTFSSLNKDFLEQYNETMNEADVPVVFFDKETFAHKNMPLLDETFVKESFGNSHIQVFTDKESLQSFLHKQEWNNKNLLLMTSGNFAGMNIEAVSDFILKKN